MKTAPSGLGRAPGQLGLGVRNVDEVYAQVKSQGVPITRELQRENWPARGFKFNDPSGNEVHITQRV